MKKVGTIILIIIFILIFSRLLYLNFYKGEYYTQQLYDKTNLYVYSSSAKRGRILDASGNVLVDNKEINAVFYNKLSSTSVKDEIDISYDLASVLDVEIASEEILKVFYLIINDNGNDLITSEEQTLYEERKITSEDIYNLKIERADISSFSEIDKEAASIYSLMNSNFEYDKKLIKEDVTAEELSLIAEKNIIGISAEITYDRVYPYGETLRSILGNIGSIHVEDKDYYLDNGYALTDIVGISYLEKEYEKYLKGEKAIYKVNSNGTLKLVKEEEAGSDIYLSIDVELQLKLDEIIKRELSLAKQNPNTEYFSDTFAVIGEPLTGSILAISGYRIMNDTYKEITSDILTSSYTVGSVVKGATMAVGYNNGIIDENTYIYDSCVKLEFRPEKCSWKPLGYINDIEALRMSSNYFQYLIAIAISNKTYSYNMELTVTEKEFDMYRNTLNEYGLGVISGIDLPGETYGTIGSTVAPDLLLNLSIGQYDTYTPLQLLQYINTVAGNKERLALSLIDKIVNDEELLYQKEKEILNSLSISDVFDGRVKEGFKVAALSGTGYGYIPSKYSPAGKTGTSESFLDSDGDGQIDASTMSLSFAGYAPYENPEYSIAIIAPHVGVQSDDDDYIYRITRYVTNDIFTYIYD